MTIPMEPAPDTLRWPHTRDGCISIHSAYHNIHHAQLTNLVDLNRTPAAQPPTALAGDLERRYLAKDKGIHVEAGNEHSTDKGGAASERCGPGNSVHVL